MTDEVETDENKQPEEKKQQPAAEKAQARQETRKRQRSDRRHHSHPLLWILIVLLGAGGASGWYGYQLWLKQQDRLAEIEQQQRQLAEQSRSVMSGVEDRLAKVNRNQQELIDYVEVIREKNQHLRKDWLVLEAEYLIQLANYRLLLERDINTAIVALEAADQRIKDTGDPALLPVRKTIAESVQSLREIEQADLAGLSLTLSAVNRDLEKLPLVTPDPLSRAQQQDTREKASENIESWHELPAAVWHDIKNLIVIRDHEQPVAPLLSPEERFFLVENLRLQLEQARLAVLSGQPKVYRERIATAIDWITKHFDQESAVTRGTLETLRQLEAANISPQLPDISATYQSLQNYRARQQNNDAIPSAGEPSQ